MHTAEEHAAEAASFSYVCLLSLSLSFEASFLTYSEAILSNEIKCFSGVLGGSGPGG